MSVQQSFVQLEDAFSIQILFGVGSKYLDVTSICFEKLTKNNHMLIPANDIIRCLYFSDPFFGQKKHLLILDPLRVKQYVFEEEYLVTINLKTHYLYAQRLSDPMVNRKLEIVQRHLRLDFGSFQEELPEQRMAIRYLTGHEKILEIGGNIGRNSLIISFLLQREKNDSNFVVLESDPQSAALLNHNKEINQLHFHIEPSALSKRPLIQSGWHTIESEVVLPNYHPVQTITWEALQEKYNSIVFDTLVLDCEGAFYFILKDMPEILDNIQLILMENDYHTLEEKEFVDTTLTNHGFYIHYREHGGFENCVCHANFFEVWRRDK